MVTGPGPPSCDAGPTGFSPTHCSTRLAIGLPDGRGLSTPDQSARPGCGVLTVLEGDFAGADGRLPAVGALDQPPRSSGQIAHDLRQAQVQVLEVDDVEIGLEAGGDDPPVPEG